MFAFLAHFLATYMVKSLTYESYIHWARSDNARQAGCPTAMADVTRHAEFDRDPWGTEFQFYCGDTLPAEAARDGFAVSSAGPDKRHGTADDVRSWE